MTAGSDTSAARLRTIEPNPNNWVCARCGSAEIESLDWVRVNDGEVMGGNDTPPDDDYWCPECEIHESPVQAHEFCAAHGHRGAPCAICGAP